MIRLARKVRSRRGSTLVEATLLSPWIFFLFIGMVDLGFFFYSMISIENALRIGVEYTSQGSTTAANQSVACAKIIAELATLPNAGSLSTCSALPLIVTATSVNGPDGAPASQVSITYRSAQLIPIPGLLTGRMTFTRTAVMRLQN